MAHLSSLTAMFTLVTLWLISLAAAADLNDILMLSNTDCNNYGSDQLACTNVPIDFCCSATMPFCHIAVYNKAEVPDYSVSAWSNTATCDTSAPPPLHCTESRGTACACMDASTPGETKAQCAALWSSSAGKENSRAAQADKSSASGCRLADTLRYTDPEGKQMEIRGITEVNFAEVMGHYHAGNYSQLAAMVV